MDQMGEFLTRIRNAMLARHEKVDVPSSKMRMGVAQVLKDKGYIKDFKVAKDNRQGIMRVYLRYNSKGMSAIEKIYRVSRPGRRVYVSYDKIPQVRSGFGMSILSTNKGIVSSEQAVNEKIGGEIICKVW